MHGILDDASCSEMSILSRPETPHFVIQAEAEVLRRARNVGGIPSKITAAGRPPESADGEPTPSKHADGASCASLPHLSSRHGDGNSETRGYKKTSPHRWVDSSVSEAIPDGVATIGSVKAAGSIASEVMDGEITNVDLLLAEALSEALEGRDEHGEETDEGGSHDWEAHGKAQFIERCRCWGCQDN